jgi:putative transposase
MQRSRLPARQLRSNPLCLTLLSMSKGQTHVYGKGHLHFITCRFFRHEPKFAVEKHRNLFVQLLEEVRVKFRFQVVGYVVMPDHFDLLMAEPEIDDTANSIETLRKRYGRRYNNSARSVDQVWETRYTDTHIYDQARIEERLRFLHDQPVKAALVEIATDWEWSSARSYAGMDEGVVTVDRVIDPKALALPKPR